MQAGTEKYLRKSPGYAIFRIVEMSPDSESIQQQKPSISQRSMENGRNRICTMRVQARVRTRSNEM